MDKCMEQTVQTNTQTHTTSRTVRSLHAQSGSTYIRTDDWTTLKVTMEHMMILSLNCALMFCKFSLFQTTTDVLTSCLAIKGSSKLRALCQLNTNHSSSVLQLN